MPEDNETEKNESLIDKIRRLITDEPDDDSPTGVGGRRRARRITSDVEAMVRGSTDEDE